METRSEIRGLLRLLGLALLSGAACVPPGNATPDDAGSSSSSQSTASLLPKPPPNVLTTVFEDNFDRPDGGAPATSASGAASGSASGAAPSSTGPEGGAEPRSKNGDGGPNANASSSNGDGGGAANADAGAPVAMRRVVEMLPDGGMVMRMVPVTADQLHPKEDVSGLGPNWMQAQTNVWHVENGWMCAENAHNHGVWFARPIPVNARIEFDAKSDSPDGDLKAELWGDGRGFAKGTSYNDATSYLTILGGWHNTLHVLARLDEHKEDRKAVHVDKDSDDPRQRPVMRGQLYHFKIERADAKTVRWYVDGLLYATFADTEPLLGPGHDHWGFNDWEAKVCFDNVKITPL